MYDVPMCVHAHTYAIHTYDHIIPFYIICIYIPSSHIPRYAYRYLPLLQYHTCISTSGHSYGTVNQLYAYTCTKVELAVEDFSGIYWYGEQVTTFLIS